MSGERPDWMTDDLIDATEEDAWGNRAVPFLLAAHAHTPLVPAARLAEVEAERDLLLKRAEDEADFTVTGDEFDRLLAERDRLRDLLRDLLRWLDDPEAAWSDITPLAHAARAALSSVEGEAPAEEKCECCEGPANRAYVHPEEGISLCGPCVADMPREGEAPAPTPEEDRCETLAGENDNFGRCQFARGHEGDHLSEYGDVFSDAQATPTVEPCPDCDACHGTGRLLGDMRIPCAPCGGAGRRPVEGEETP